MAISITETGLLKLLQLSSASLPVGGYAFSQGLEYAVDQQWLSTPDDVRDWLQVQLQHSLARVDAPLLQRMLTALRNRDSAAFEHWNKSALACRETKELLLTDTAMGEALWRLLRQLRVSEPWTTGQEYGATRSISFVAAFAIAACHWQVTDEAACLGYLWSWLENQVAAATKLVPLGQTQAQQLLCELQQQVPLALGTAASLADDELGASLPALAIASANHETQYSRLFRS